MANATAEELLAIYQQTRLAPLGNTFVDEKQEQEPQVVRRRRSITLKANSIPEYIPHQVVSMYGDTDLFENESPLFDCAFDGDSDREKVVAKVPMRSASPDVANLPLEMASPGLAFTRSVSEPAVIDIGPPAVGDSDDKVLQRPRGRRNRAGGPSMTPMPSDGALTSSRATENKVDPGNITTLMIRNLPHELVQSQLAAEIDQSGFKGLYDFLYMPSTFGTGRGKGYAFVNFATPEVANKFSALWHSTCRFGPPSEHALLNVSVACIQGRDANVARWDTSKMRRIRNANHRPLVSALAAETASVPPAPAATQSFETLMSQALAKTLGQNAMPPYPVPAPGLCLQEPVEPSLVGKWCKITGLVEMAYANGFWGIVEGYDQQSKRYILRVPVDADQSFLLKILPANLEQGGEEQSMPLAPTPCGFDLAAMKRDALSSSLATRHMF